MSFSRMLLKFLGEILEQRYRAVAEALSTTNEMVDISVLSLTILND